MSLRSFWSKALAWFRKLWVVIKESEASSEFMDLLQTIGEEVWEDIENNPTKYLSDLLSSDREEKIKAWFKEVRKRADELIQSNPEYDQIRNIAYIINIVYPIVASKMLKKKGK